MSVLPAFWVAIGVSVWGLGALMAAIAAAWLNSRRERYGPARGAVILATGLTALWAIAGAVTGNDTPATIVAESLRDLAWIFALYRLFRIDGRDASIRPVRPLLFALGFVEFLKLALILVLAAGTNPSAMLVGFHTQTMLGLLVSTGGLVLAHNLYGGASPQARVALRWPSLAVALLWGYDLNYQAIAYLSGTSPGVLGALRGVTALGLGGLLAFGAHKDSDNLRFRPSRTVAFQSASLVVIGGYLVVMVAVAQWLAFAGGDFSDVLQLGFVALATFAALLLLPSRRLRGWLRVTLTKHLFQHRYDYRAEWLRFTRTIGHGGPGNASLEERVIRAIADITDSPSGMLLMPDDQGQLTLAARWQWPTADVPAMAMDAESARGFESGVYIADLDELRAGKEAKVSVPQWLVEEARAWALVPLVHFDRLVGMVVLARPPLARRLDWEDFDLLRVAGKQLASYLAEHAGQEALAEASRFDDFHRRIAFVMHDIKNLASQFSLLARNAELHAENPEFRADMLITLRNSADKLNALIARLSRYGAAAIDALAPVRADEIAASVVQRFAGQHQVMLVECTPCEVSAEREGLEQVLLHLIQNAVDASPADSPVSVSVAIDGLRGQIEVVDSGIGMSAEFVRSRLFKPFDSTKTGGFGIGAYEARELVRAMQGRLDVESREGLGTRFIIQLPLAETAELLKNFNDPSRKVA